MIPFILLGAALLGTAAVAYTFWDEIKAFLKESLEKVKKMVKGTIIGVCTFIQTKDISKGIKAFNKFYSKTSDGKWTETIVSKEVSEDEIPEHIRRKAERASGKEVEITDELQHELGV